MSRSSEVAVRAGRARPAGPPGIRRAVLAATALTAGLMAVPAAAQQTYYVRPGSGWLGVTYEVSWLQYQDDCQPRVLVEHVVQGSPAERAGLRPGDALLSLNGRPVPDGRLDLVAATLAPGDSVAIRFLRQGRTRDATAVADRRPERPVVLEWRADGLDASTAPILRLRADTLEARNMESVRSGRVRGYWLADGEGRAEYRRAGSLARSEVDRRMARLVSCVENRARRPPSYAPAVAAVDLREVQERADSLRVLIARRLLERDREVETAVQAAVEGRDREAPDPPRVAAWLFRSEDHLTAGLRGVAGAEVTELEPELAEYFRNADRGLLVLRIAPGTPADRAGLRPGDVIVRGDGRRVDTVGALRTLIAVPGPEPVELRVVRQGQTRTLTLRRN